MIRTLRILPTTLKKRIRTLLALPRYGCGLTSCYLYDMRRYFRAASKGHEFVRAGKLRQTELRAWIVADTHKIEKGLSLRSPRPGFGEPVARRLIENLAAYTKSFGMDQSVAVASNTLNSYCGFHAEHGIQYSEIADELNAMVASRDIPGNDGGILKIDRDAVLHRSCLPGIEGFFSSRHSVRDFSSEPVDLVLIQRAVKMAQKTPSVCNRQSWKAYVFMDEAEKKKLLDLQLGNRGFGEQAGAVLIIAADLGTFFSYGERNQVWIDGGMFAMSLVYGLHAVGLGCCCLNWCAEPKRDRRIHDLANIPENEVVIMLIAVGHLPNELNVARSVRKPIDEVLIAGRTKD